MNLIYIQTPILQAKPHAHELNPGTWFIDQDYQVCAVVLDNRTDERRVFCAAISGIPYISKNLTNSYKVKQILPSGTHLLISTSLNQEGQ